MESRYLSLRQVRETGISEKFTGEIKLFKKITGKCLVIERMKEITDEFFLKGEMSGFELIKVLKDK
ncbi:MAG: hypothetical protein Q4D53_05275 [Leptotrichiaceae bacterium]|nr:hypothetical protein [Leptotrichiaceae bacterium]